MPHKKLNEERIERWEDVPPVLDRSIAGGSAGNTLLKETRLTDQERLKKDAAAEELFATYDGRITSGQEDDPLPALVAPIDDPLYDPEDELADDSDGALVDADEEDSED
jgi:hypothetical protein